MVEDFEKIKKQLSSLKGSKKIKKIKIKKVLKSPRARLPSHSPTKFVADLAQSQGSLVHEIQNRYANPPQDNRSLFFRESFQEEEKKHFGGFI